MLANVKEKKKFYGNSPESRGKFLKNFVFLFFFRPLAASRSPKKPCQFHAKSPHLVWVKLLFNFHKKQDWIVVKY